VAQVDFFLKIEGIEGESEDRAHKGEIEVLSWSFGASNPSSVGSGGGGGTGKVVIQDFHFMAKTGIQSPLLFLATAQGEHFKKATLTCRKAGEKQVDYIKIKLTDVLVSSYQAGAADAPDDNLPRDQFSLNFSKIEMSVSTVNADGSVSKTVTAGYDVKANKKV